MRNWEVSIGLYHGVLIGMRTYQGINKVSHVLYLPFIDLCIDVYNERTDITRDEK